MEIAIRPQLDGSLELEPTDSDCRNIIRFYNENNCCIAYIPQSDVEDFVSGMCDVDVLEIVRGKTIIIEMSTKDFDALLEH